MLIGEHFSFGVFFGALLGGPVGFDLKSFGGSMPSFDPRRVVFRETHAILDLTRPHRLT
ncbi:hypothetical protein [Thioclava sp. DLFJ5-1]|uniref:hypothetical protein n=1 Tax=Thioclava sp. DLFJ5-1 TaxID=1915314 RepID=UPI00143AD6B9|nr:hypothetical protein [Thioclava sp. DLFJ5-1]